MKKVTVNEEKLIEQCIDENRQAQKVLFNHFYSELYLLAMRYLSDHYEAEDAIVLSFTKVYKKLNTFNYSGSGSLGKWIRTILIHEAIRLLHKRRKLHYSNDALHLQIQNEAANGLEQMHAADIQKMIERLPAGYRTVFNLYVVEGFSHKEIAALLGVSESTSKTQLKKARTSLMNTIKKEQSYGIL